MVNIPVSPLENASPDRSSLHLAHDLRLRGGVALEPSPCAQEQRKSGALLVWRAFPVSIWQAFLRRPIVRHARYARSSRSEEHTSELQSLMRISYAVFCLKKKNKTNTIIYITIEQ